MNMPLKTKLGIAVTLLTALSVLLIIFDVTCIKAEGDYGTITNVAPPELTVEKSGDDLIMKLVAQAETDLDGFSGKVTYDHDKFTYDKSDFLNVGLQSDISTETDIIVAYEKNHSATVYESGENIFTLTFHIRDGENLESGEEYRFEFRFGNDQGGDAYNFDLDDYIWNNDKFIAVYKEESGQIFVISDRLEKVYDDASDADPTEGIPTGSGNDNNSGNSLDPDPANAAGRNTGSGVGAAVGNAGSKNRDESDHGDGSDATRAADSGDNVLNRTTTTAKAQELQTTAKTTVKTNPSTSDNQNILIWSFLLAFAIISVSVILVLIPNDKSR